MAGRRKLDAVANFYELPRRQLQSLCKKYGFPANKTNHLMAEFLTAHLGSEGSPHVDGSLDGPAMKTNAEVCQSGHSESEGSPHGDLFLDSPAVKTNAGVCQSEMNQFQQLAESSLPSTSTSQPIISDMHATSLSKSFVDDGAQTDCTPVVCESKEIYVSEASQNMSPPKAGGTFANSETEGCAAVPHVQNEAGQESPLPLSVMPYVCLVTPPEFYVANNKGVKLFVDLGNDSWPRIDFNLPGDNLKISISGDKRRDYQAWAGPTTVCPNRTQDDILRSFKSLLGTERNLPMVVSQSHTGLNGSGTEEKPQEEETQDQLQERTYTVNSRITVAAPLKSTLFSPKSKSSLKLSFLNPAVHTSTRSTNALVQDVRRSDIVQEWSAGKEDKGLFEHKCSGHSDEVLNSSAEECNVNEELRPWEVEENAVGQKPVQHEMTKPGDKASDSSAEELSINDELHRTEPNEIALNQEPTHMNRPQQSSSELESPPEGIVKKAVQIFEEEHSTKVEISSNRKDSYKNSPFVKSSRVAADLERASKLGQARRVEILALKRGMGVMPVMWSSPEHPEKIGGHDSGFSTVSASVTDVIMVDGHSPPDNVGSAERAVSTPNETSEADIRPDVSGVSLPTFSCLSESGQKTLKDRASCVPVSPSYAESVVLASGRPNDTLTSDGALQMEVALEKGERKVSDRSPITSSEQSEGPLADETANLPASIEDSVSNLSWMTKPLHVPIRKPTLQKSKEKAGCTLTANGRKLELMERAAVRVSKKKCSMTRRALEEEVIENVLKTGSLLNENHQNQGCEEPTDDEAQQEKLAMTGSAQLPIVTNLSPSQIQSRPKLSMSPGIRLEESRRKVDNAAPTSTVLNATELKTQWCPDSIDVKGTVRPDPELAKIEANAAEELPTPPLRLQKVDIAQPTEKKVDGTPPQKNVLSLLDVDFTKTRERPAALSPIDSNKWSLGDCTARILSQDASWESGGKENNARRQDQYKTPLTGRAKEKAWLSAQMNAVTLRENLLKQRRGWDQTPGPDRFPNPDFALV